MLLPNHVMVSTKYEIHRRAPFPLQVFITLYGTVQG